MVKKVGTIHPKGSFPCLFIIAGCYISSMPKNENIRLNLLLLESVWIWCVIWSLETLLMKINVHLNISNVIFVFSPLSTRQSITVQLSLAYYIIFHWGHLPSKIVVSHTKVDLQMLESQFSTFSAISLLFRTDGRVAGGLLEKSRLRLTQPSLAWTGAELVKNRS